METEINYLADHYNESTLKSILEETVTSNCFPILFHNSLTDNLQSLTNVQLYGLVKFRGINILLETGQTFQIALEVPMQGTFQEIYFADLIVDNVTLNKIQKEFKFDK